MSINTVTVDKADLIPYPGLANHRLPNPETGDQKLTRHLPLILSSHPGLNTISASVLVEGNAEEPKKKKNTSRPTDQQSRRQAVSMYLQVSASICKYQQISICSHAYGILRKADGLKPMSNDLYYHTRYQTWVRFFLPRTKYIQFPCFHSPYAPCIKSFSGRNTADGNKYSNLLGSVMEYEIVL